MIYQRTPARTEPFDRTRQPTHRNRGLKVASLVAILAVGITITNVFEARSERSRRQSTEAALAEVMAANERLIDHIQMAGPFVVWEFAANYYGDPTPEEVEDGFALFADMQFRKGATDGED